MLCSLLSRLHFHTVILYECMILSMHPCRHNFFNFHLRLRDFVNLHDNSDAWFLQWVKTDALTETNIFVPQKWMVGVLWSNIVIFWGGHPFAIRVRVMWVTPQWLAYRVGFKKPRGDLPILARLMCGGIAGLVAQGASYPLHVTELHVFFRFAPAKVKFCTVFLHVGRVDFFDNPQEMGGGSNRILPMDLDVYCFIYTSFFVVKSCWKLSAQPKKAMILPRRALVMNVISKVVRRRMQVQGYVHGQSKQLNLSVKDSTTVENAVSFW